MSQLSLFVMLACTVPHQSQQTLASPDGLQPCRPVGADHNCGFHATTLNIISMVVKLAMSEPEAFKQIEHPKTVVFVVVWQRRAARLRKAAPLVEKKGTDLFISD